MVKVSPDPEFRFSNVSRLIALFGSHIRHSKSVTLQNRWFREINLNYLYMRWTCKDVAEFFATFEVLNPNLNFWGANITLPFKETALRLPSVHKSRCVEEVGAANTLYRCAQNTQQWCLENTDVHGIAVSLNQLLLTSGNPKYNAVVLGGGGASRATLWVLLRDVRCSKIIVILRDSAKGTRDVFFNKLVHSFSNKLNIVWADASGQLQETQFDRDFSEIWSGYSNVLINTTPLGTYGEFIPYFSYFQPYLLEKKLSFFDMIYLISPTQWFCELNKVNYIGGTLMLTAQAQKAFGLWTEGSNPLIQ